MVTESVSCKPRVIVGLGNPEARFARNRHNIGFQIANKLVEAHNGQWRGYKILEAATISFGEHSVTIVKPQTYMNNSGEVVPFLKKEGLLPVDMLVVHDELELPFGKLAFKFGGSAKGHNGLKSLIERWGTADFWRLRFGIGRPQEREQVPQFVLQNFENIEETARLVQEACGMIENLYSI